MFGEEAVIAWLARPVWHATFASLAMFVWLARSAWLARFV